MRNMMKVYRCILTAFKIFLLIFAINVGIHCLVDPNYTKYGGFLAGLVLPFGPNIIRWLFKSRITPRIELIYYIFVFVALDLGICLDYYKTVPFFDKAVHLCSGVFSAWVGHYALQHWHANTAPDHFKALFIMCFSLGIAVIWEFFEFGCDKLLGQSMQQLVSVGVDDTMYDLIAAFIGSAIGGYLLTSPYFVAFIDWFEPEEQLKALKKVEKNHKKVH